MWKLHMQRFYEVIFFKQSMLLFGAKEEGGIPPPPFNPQKIKINYIPMKKKHQFGLEDALAA